MSREIGGTICKAFYGYLTTTIPYPHRARSYRRATHSRRRLATTLLQAHVADRDVDRSTGVIGRRKPRFHCTVATLGCQRLQRAPGSCREPRQHLLLTNRPGQSFALRPLGAMPCDRIRRQGGLRPAGRDHETTCRHANRRRYRARLRQDMLPCKPIRRACRHVRPQLLQILFSQSNGRRV